MNHAQICPVCDGSGKYKENICHGCEGKGWVEVSMDYHPPRHPAHIYPEPWWPWSPHTPREPHWGPGTIWTVTTSTTSKEEEKEEDV